MSKEKQVKAVLLNGGSSDDKLKELLELINQWAETRDNLRKILRIVGEVGLIIATIMSYVFNL
jgi:hypothetical protein